jgi:hypothetical protein
MRASASLCHLVTQATVPSPAYQQYVLQPTSAGRDRPITGTTLPAQPQEVPSTSRCSRSTATQRERRCRQLLPAGCERALLPGPQSGNLFNGSGCANHSQESMNNSDSENLIVVKIDHTINANNSVWYRFQQDTGLQAAYTDPINSIFNSYSPQPQRTLVAGYTHIFTPNLVNQFNPGASWYSSIFEPNNYAAGAADLSHRARRGQQQRALHHHRRQRQYLSAGPQGHAVADQRQPDLDARQAQLHFGVNTRRVDVSDYDLGEGSVPTVVYNDLAEFTYGAAYTASQTFPISLKERVAAGNLDLYAMDTYKPFAQMATLIAGCGDLEHQSRQSARLFARPAGSFLDLSHASTSRSIRPSRPACATCFPATPLLGLAAARLACLPGLEPAP